MSKTKSDKVPHYELLYLISNKFSETELEPITSKIEKLITDNSGTITVKQDWGKKKLAYPISGFRHGYYQLVEFDLTDNKVNYIDNQIRLTSEILRHQIVRTEPKTPEQIKAAEELRAKVLQKLEDKEEALVEAATTAKAEADAKAVKVEAPVNTAPEILNDKVKLELNDLDDKLNKILESDNLL